MAWNALAFLGLTYVMRASCICARFYVHCACIGHAHCSHGTCINTTLSMRFWLMHTLGMHSECVRRSFGIVRPALCTHYAIIGSIASNLGSLAGAYVFPKLN